jgi:hypothetical protein
LLATVPWEVLISQMVKLEEDDTIQGARIADLNIVLRMDGGFCGYPRISADLVDVDWTVGGLDAGLVDVDVDMDG